MRLTDFCHLNELRAPVPRAFPARYAAFTAWTSHGVLGSVRLDRGTECFTALVNALADRQRDTRCLFCLGSSSRLIGGPGNPSVGVIFPRRLLPIEPLTSLSPLPLPRNVGGRLRVS